MPLHAITRRLAMLRVALIVGMLLPLVALAQGTTAPGPWLPPVLLQGHVQAAQAMSQLGACPEAP